MSDKKRVYILTGAAGHLGGAVAKILQENGETVYALCLSGEKHVPEGLGLRVFYGDVTDIGSLDKIFERGAGAELIVVHCAGIVSISSGFDEKVYDVNVNGTKNVIALCERHGVKKLIYVSSVHAIPEKPEGETITEVNVFDPDGVTGLYAKTKAEASQCVLDYAKRGNFACVVHPSGLVGPGDYGRGHITQLIIDYYKGRLASLVKGGYDFADVRDVAAGVVSCCERGACGECYILSGSYRTIVEIIGILHKITGKKEIKRTLPRWFVSATAPLSELYYKILRQPPLFTSYSIFTLRQNARFNREKATNELGYASRPIEETLSDTVDWLKEHGRI
ncbi:MAG: NAD-dependent epimerase/dehydratase family protein [Defluviitaleaceae bacterium]|nr:NAD-dependent epimerase/dehydratase family protein [Defluviitaleaceae bacterium]